MNVNANRAKEAAALVVMTTALIAFPVALQVAMRDITGTTGYDVNQDNPEVAWYSIVVSASSFQAERMGFEPMVPLRRLRFSRPVGV
jgi:hypothetical protein